MNEVVQGLRERGMWEFMDFKGAVNKVLKRWYEQRIEEETERNRKLRELHENLTRMKILREEEQMRKGMEVEEEDQEIGKEEDQEENGVEERKR